MNQSFGLRSAALLLTLFGCSSAGSPITGTGGGGVGSNGVGSAGTEGGTTGVAGPGAAGTGTGQGMAGVLGSGAAGSSSSGAAGVGNNAGTTGTATGAAGRAGTGGTAGTSGQAGTSGAAGTVASGPPCPKPQGQICHEFIANDNSGNHRVNYVNEFTSSAPGGVVWTANVPDLPADSGLNNSPRTIQLVDNAAAKGGKSVLVSIDQGYAELDATDGKPITLVTSFRGISGAVRIPEDNTTALARGSDNTILIVGAPPNTGTIRMFTIPPGDNLRAINRNPVTKNFWLTHTEKIYEVTDRGQTVHMFTMPTGSKGYAAWWREGGGTYASTGDPSSVVEINAEGMILSTVGGKSKFPTFLDFFSGFARLPNGNYVIANWLGHLGSATGEFASHQIIEFTPDNKLVWQWGSSSLARQITNVFVVR